MVGKLFLYTGLLIGTYLLVANATGAGRVIQAGASGYATAVKALQGR
jgi:hypothetical protein